ncbi:MAG: chromosome segregation protein SMC [Ruminococcus sp.]|jgi:chromosome segregation protein|nr:chromosome segregation protein SMC [Ruminococcus sp.]
MYLESIEIQGFKSFPDKIKLSFDKGITGIVGPNGSGKSNIGDAVRWVLGEQSSKTLRGSKMEDVIFAGTQSRRAMGYASVTLNIAHSGEIRGIPTGLLSVTRKLHRTGESEYLINGSSARLRDVVEIFMDTGLGRDGYAIIGQGRVAEIVSGKSSERREIFEEAAGIAKLRFKRDESQRQLGRAEDNLVRLRDIIGELEIRVEPLKQQSEQAREFILLEEQKKSLETSVWITQLDNLNVSQKENADEILVNKSYYENTSSEMDRLEAENEELFKNSQEISIAREKLRVEIAERRKANSQIEADCAVAENDIKHAEERIKELEDRLRENESSGITSRDVIEQKFGKIREKEADIEALKNAEILMHTEIEEISVKRATVDAQYAEVNSNLSKAILERSELRFKKSNAEEVLQSANMRISETDGQIEALKAEISEFEKENADLRESKVSIEVTMEELKNRSAGLYKLLSSKRAKLEAAKADFEHTRLSLSEKQQRVKLLTDLERNMEGYAPASRAILKLRGTHAISGICGSVGEILSVPKEYTTAIETALGAALQNIIVENEETAKRCINHLKETHAGRTTFLPITSVKGNILNEKPDGEDGFIDLAVNLVDCDSRYDGIARNLLGRIAVFEDLDTAAGAAKKFGYRFKIVTLDGQVINAGGSFTGGSQNKSSGILTRKNDIEKLNAEISSGTALLEEKKRSVVSLTDEASKMEFDIEGAKDAVRIAESDLIRFDSEIRRTDSLKAKSEENRDALIKRLENIRAETKKAEETLSGIDELLSATDKNVEILEKELNEQGPVSAELVRQREAISEKISECKLRQAECGKDIESLNAEILNLEEQCRKIGDSAFELTAAIDSQRVLINEKRDYIEKRKKDTEDITEETDRITLRISELGNDKNETERKINENRTLSRQLSDKRETLSKEGVHLEERQISIQTSIDNITKNMSESYGIYPTEARSIARPIADMNLAQSELRRLKNSIKDLGVVNLAAIEEYKEVSERYNFLKGQIDDLEISKKELLRLIADFTDNMKTLFADSFYEINTNFKRIFTELFGGGKAELTLTDPDDILESGIEIFVAPPGKVIKSLSLLSGGEQAFVAIAIYFAILTVKPSPFCVLDEIEAALDDINVVKYARYLRKFTKSTQFICVTHRRGTMDEADILYGVTMQEKGISRILKLENSDDFKENS